MIHHRDEDKENNKYSNLQLLSRGDHARLHATGRKMSPESIAKMKVSAKKRCADPEHLKGMLERAKAQHASGNLGAHNLTEAGRENMSRAGKKSGSKQADRLRAMIAATPSAEMSRRSYQRKLFQKATTVSE